MRNSQIQNVPDPGFPRQARLLTAADYAQVFNRAKRLNHAYFTLLNVPGMHTHARLGMAVSKAKCAKRAVDRNRLKRVFRECFRQHPLKCLSVDLVVIPRKAAVAASHDELTTAFNAALDKLEQIYQRNQAKNVSAPK